MLRFTMINAIGLFTFYLLNCAAAHTDSPSLLNQLMQAEKQKKLQPLAGVTGFQINYVFFNKILEISLETALMNSLQQVGIVLTDDDSKLTESQREEKRSRKKMGIFITAHQIAGFSDSNKKSVIQLCLEISDAILLNGTVQRVPLWKNEIFLELSSEEEKQKMQAISAINSLLDSFMKDYRIVNAEKSSEKLMFFIAPPIYKDFLHNR